MELYRYLEISERNKFNAKTTDKNDKLPQVEYKGELPFEIVEYQLCQMFNCLPSQLDLEESQRIMKLFAIGNALNKYENMQYSDKNDKTPVRTKLMLEILKLEKELNA